MPIPAFLEAIIAWLFREAVLKFVIFGALFALLSVLGPMLVSLAAPFVSSSSLASSFGNLPAGVGWMFNAFALDVGLPLLISAKVARFAVRRLPVIG